MTITALAAPAASAQQDMRAPDARHSTSVGAGTSRVELPGPARKPSASGRSDWSGVILGSLGVLAALLCVGTIVIARRFGRGVATAVADGTRRWRRGVGL